MHFNKTRMMYSFFLGLVGLLFAEGISSAHGFRSALTRSLPRASSLVTTASSRARINRICGHLDDQSCSRRRTMDVVSSIRGGASPGSKVISISDADEFMEFIKKQENNRVVVDFSASWCGPCKMLAPLYDGWAVDPRFNSIKFVKVDPDQTMSLVQSYGVRAFPTLLAIKDGAVVDQFVGAHPPAIEQMLLRLRDR